MRAATLSAFLGKTAQVIALLCLLAYFLLLVHKAFIDISALLAAHPGNFLVALGRHFLRNLGGG